MKKKTARSKRKESLFEIVFLIFIFIGGIAVGVLGNEIINSLSEHQQKKIDATAEITIDYNDTCIYEDLEETLFCLRNELMKFYYYNSSERGKEYNEEKLKEIGGVCSQYSKWYLEKVKERGFLGEYISFGVPKDKHAVAIIYNSNMTEYCLMDQRGYPLCNYLKGDDEDTNKSIEINLEKEYDE